MDRSTPMPHGCFATSTNLLKPYLFCTQGSEKRDRTSVWNRSNQHEFWSSLISVYFHSQLHDWWNAFAFNFQGVGKDAVALPDPSAYIDSNLGCWWVIFDSWTSTTVAWKPWLFCLLLEHPWNLSVRSWKHGTWGANHFRLPSLAVSSGHGWWFIIYTLVNWHSQGNPWHVRNGPS